MFTYIIFWQEFYFVCNVFLLCFIVNGPKSWGLIRLCLVLLKSPLWQTLVYTSLFLNYVNFLPPVYIYYGKVRTETEINLVLIKLYQKVSEFSIVYPLLLLYIWNVFVLCLLFCINICSFNRCFYGSSFVMICTYFIIYIHSVLFSE